jgi:hypothetical protein
MYIYIHVHMSHIQVGVPQCCAPVLGLDVLFCFVVCRIKLSHIFFNVRVIMGYVSLHVCRTHRYVYTLSCFQFLSICMDPLVTK